MLLYSLLLMFHSDQVQYLCHTVSWIALAHMPTIRLYWCSFLLCLQLLLTLGIKKRKLEIVEVSSIAYLEKLSLKHTCKLWIVLITTPLQGEWSRKNALLFFFYRTIEIHWGKCCSVLSFKWNLGNSLISGTKLCKFPLSYIWFLCLRLRNCSSVLATSQLMVIFYWAKSAAAPNTSCFLLSCILVLV